jgi:hypothetical protein
MNHEVTSRSQRLLRDLRSLAGEIDEQSLARASAEARHEWSSLLGCLPTDADLRRGVILTTEDELEGFLTKASRFREILRSIERSSPSLAMSAASDRRALGA